MTLSSTPGSSHQILISQADQSSLGYLDEALSLIAQECARATVVRIVVCRRLRVISTGTNDFEHEYEHEHDMNTYTIGDLFPFPLSFLSTLASSCHVIHQETGKNM